MLSKRDDARHLTVPRVEVRQRRGEEDRGPEPARRPGPRAAGAGQHLHAGCRRHEHYRVDRQGRHCRRQYRLGADVRQGAGGAERSLEAARERAGAEHLLRRELPERVRSPAWSSPYFNAFIASPRPPQGMRYVINTSAAPEHVGGNEKLAAAATFKRAGGAGGFGGAVRDSAPRRRSSPTRACSTAHEHAADGQAGGARSMRGRATRSSTSSTSCPNT